MSFPPPPHQYSPPGRPPASAFGDGRAALAPARQASLLLLIGGGIVMLFGAYMTLNAFVVSSDELQKVLDEKARMTQQASPLSAQDTRVLAIIFGMLVMSVAVAMLGLAVPVRRGSPGWIIAGMVVMIPIAAFAGLFGVLFLLFTFVAGPAALALALLFFAASGGFAWVSATLIFALRGVRRMRLAHAQAHLMWQAQQAQPGALASQPSLGPVAPARTASPFAAPPPPPATIAPPTIGPIAPATLGIDPSIPPVGLGTSYAAQQRREN